MKKSIIKLTPMRFDREGVEITNQYRLFRRRPKSQLSPGFIIPGLNLPAGRQDLVLLNKIFIICAT
ncbi:MAG: hypothetical protein WCA84_08710 [Ignavibacteriaceae bacterium]